MSGQDEFQPVTRAEPCVICGKPDWCRRSASGAHECHRVDQSKINGLMRVAVTSAGFAVYRRPADRPPSKSRTTAATAKRPRVFDSPNDAADSFASWKRGSVEAIYRWSDDWQRARIRLPTGKTYCEIVRRADGWVLRGPPKPHPLYRVNDLPSEGVVCVCEGEKACDAGWSIGLPCVTSGAANSARSADWSALRGREVAILPDHDEPGRRYAVETARQLRACDPQAIVRIVNLPELRDGEDLHDFVNEHRDSREADDIKEELLALIANTPAYEFAQASGSADDHWPDPQPLPDVMPPVDAFDPSVLPQPLRRWIEDIAERIQCPIDYVAIGATVALAAVVGRKVGIRPKRQDSWLVVPNLWGAIIGRPGVMKSPALMEVLKPIKRLEAEANEAFDRELQDFATAKMVDEIRRKENNKAISKAVRDGGDAHAIAAELIAGNAKEPLRKRFLVNDSTVEKLGALLIENPNGVLCYRDELVGFLTSLDREGQEGARSFYLEAWNGTGRFTYDRIGRGTLDIEACCVSVLGGIQPGPLGRYLRSAVQGGNGDDGLLQRFQLAVWPDTAREWHNVDRWPDTDARDLAHSVFRRLDALNVEELGTRCDGFDVEGIPYLRFAEDAQSEFDDWRATLEAKVRNGDEHPAVEAHLAKFRSLVPSLALLIHLAEDGTGPVTKSAVERAIGWSAYLESHARRIYAMVARADVAAAHKLAKKLRDKALSDGFSLRDVYRSGWAGLAGREEAVAAVQVLADHDWLEVAKEHTDGAPRTRHWVNPKIYRLAPKGTDKTDIRGSKS